MSRLTSGRSLNPRFTLVRPLGRGGMAEVWLVHDGELDEQLVAKIVPSGASESELAWLRRECSHARRLNHPNIVRVFDYRRGTDHDFITMAHVDGEELGSYRGEAPARLLPLLIPTAEALAYAHSRGVVHRDLKLSNVLVDGSGQPHILDFGISARIDAEPDDGVRGGGTRYVRSPQQLDGEAPQIADDVYAFGAMVFELLSGRPPFWPDEDPGRVRQEPPEPLRSTHPVPPELDALVRALLAKRPEDRPGDMGAVAAALRRILDRLEVASESPGRERAGVRLTPPPKVGPIRAGGGPPRRPPRTPQGPTATVRWLTAVGLGLLILAAAAVVFLLPRWAETRRSREVVKVPEPIAPAPVVEASPEPVVAAPGRSAAELREEAYRRETADAVRRATEEVQQRLEAQEVRLWAVEAFEAAGELLRDGDAMRAARDYAGARGRYADAERALTRIEAGSGAAVERLVAEGRKALDSGDAVAAGGAFRLAATIDPEHAGAEQGLQQASVYEDVRALLRSAERHEQAGDLAEALRGYREAAGIDPRSRAARDGVARVEVRILDEAFSAHMSAGLSAMHAREFVEAREAFGRAAQLRPDAPEVAEALVQVDSADKTSAIAALREEAVVFEATERWKDAAERYGEVLKLDPTIHFAQLGQTRCLERAHLAERMEFHLAHPDRLSTDRVLARATDLVETAEQVEEPGPRHLELLGRLAALVERASTPVPVYLESDDATEVTVYKVGRLGTFTRHELTLRPGTYTVVGSREGYRDVRHSLVVEAGQEPAFLRVRCEEKI